MPSERNSFIRGGLTVTNLKNLVKQDRARANKITVAALISSSIISGLRQSRPGLHSLHKDLQDNVQLFFLIVIQSQALKKGELKYQKWEVPGTKTPALCQDPGIATSPQRGLENSIYLPRKWTSVGALGGMCACARVRVCLYTSVYARVHVCAGALLNSDKISWVPTVCSPRSPPSAGLCAS